MNIKKRGDLSIEELVKLILGALVLVAIIVLLAQLVKIAHSNVQAEQANNTMNKLEYEIQRWNLPEGMEKEFLVESPVNYFIWAFNSKACICPKDFLSNSDILKSNNKESDIFKVCSSSGFCISNINAEMFSGQVGSMDSSGRPFDTQMMCPGYLSHCVVIKTVPLFLKLKNESGKILISAIDNSNTGKMKILDDLSNTIDGVKRSGSGVFTINLKDSVLGVGDGKLCLCQSLSPSGKWEPGADWKLCKDSGFCKNINYKIGFVDENTWHMEGDTTTGISLDAAPLDLNIEKDASGNVVIKVHRTTWQLIRSSFGG